MNRPHPRGTKAGLVELLGIELWRGRSCGLADGGSGVRIIVTDHACVAGWPLDGVAVPVPSGLPADPGMMALLAVVSSVECSLRSAGDDGRDAPAIKERG
jgi:hypothetical protein